MVVVSVKTRKSHIVLASASPWRAQLLAQLRISFEPFPVGIDEARLSSEAAEDYVARLALDKARAARRRKQADAAVLAADTVIALDGELMGKPADRADAKRMLTTLSGASHRVLTGVALVTGEGVDAGLDDSRVRFTGLDETRVERYLDTGEYRGKAGAYAIQGRAAAFVERLEGSYSGVMGLPLFVVARLLTRRGLLEAT